MGVGRPPQIGSDRMLGKAAVEDDLGDSCACPRVGEGNTFRGYFSFTAADGLLCAIFCTVADCPAGMAIVHGRAPAGSFWKQHY